MSYALHKSKGDRVTDVIINTALVVFSLASLFPLYYVFVMSVTPFDELLRNGGFVMLPSGFTLEAYRSILGSAVVPQAFL